MLHVDADSAFKVKKKRGLVAGAPEISRWLEPEPNPIHFSPTATKSVRAVCETSLSRSQCVQSRILHCWWDWAWGREKCGTVTVGSVKHCTFPRADLGSVPGETSLHLISATRAEQGGSESLGCLPIPALSGHFPTTPHLRQHGQEVDNEAILHRASMPFWNWSC